ncbi:MAG: prolipoprotein diacylglyceryl transferase [Meiothermus sp.]|nr:prolipoprotein diacylglyceryl transferase [Meiothermus sp.]
MDPVMIELGPLKIYWYGLFMVIGIFASFEISKRIVKSWGLDADQLEQIGFWAVIWGVVGARLFYVVTSPSEFVNDPVKIFQIWQGGISIHGGLLFGMVPFIWALYRYKAPALAYFDAIAPGVGIAIALGRLGNIMNGSDTVGRLTNWPIGFTWPASASGFPGVCPGINDISEVFTKCASDAIVRGPVHFTQFYGILIGIALFLMCLYWLRQNRPYGYVFWNFVLWYSLFRAGLEETFRLNPLWVPVYTNTEAGIGLFTATQIISIPLIIVAAYFVLTWKKGPRENPPLLGYGGVPVPSGSEPKPGRSERKK